VDVNCAALKLNNTEASLMAEHAGLRLVAFNMGLSLRTQMYGKGKLLDSKSMEESKNLLTDRLKKPPELNWMNQLSDRMYQNALINLKDALSRYRFGRSSDSTFADRRNGQSGALYLSNRKIVSHPKNTIIVSPKACKKPAKNLPHKHYGRSIIKIATLGTFDLDEPLNYSLVAQTFTVKKKLVVGWFHSAMPKVYHSHNPKNR